MFTLITFTITVFIYLGYFLVKSYLEKKEDERLLAEFNKMQQEHKIWLAEQAKKGIFYADTSSEDFGDNDEEDLPF